MKYPDGSTIKIGDLIWWDEGYCVGYVQAVAESRAELGSWGFDKPHILVSNIHPFDPASHTGVAYGESFLTDDGIGLLTPEERVQFEQATAQAHKQVAADFEYSAYSVFTDVRDCKLTGRIFSFRKADGTELQRIKVPANK